MSIFGDKSKFAIEVDFIPDPNNDKGVAYDEVGTYGHFNIFVKGMSLFKYHHYDHIDNDTEHKVLDTFTEYDNGRTDHLGPIYDWLGYVYDVVTSTSKTRFKRCELMHSPYGLSGNIYPQIFIKRSGNNVTIGSDNTPKVNKNFPPAVRHFQFRTLFKYTVSEKITISFDEFITILYDVLKSYYDNPVINTQQWFKDRNLGFKN